MYNQKYFAFARKFFCEGNNDMEGKITLFCVQMQSFSKEATLLKCVNAKAFFLSYFPTSL